LALSSPTTKQALKAQKPAERPAKTTEAPKPARPAVKKQPPAEPADLLRSDGEGTMFSRHGDAQETAVSLHEELPEEQTPKTILVPEPTQSESENTEAEGEDAPKKRRRRRRRSKPKAAGSPEAS
jgi:hypothetical protein